MIEPNHARLSIVRQCQLISIARSSHYYVGRGETPLNLALMRLIDTQYLLMPWYGSRQMARHLRRQGYCVGRKRTRRLMRLMGLTAIYRRPRTSTPNPAHKIYPYLLRDLQIDRPDHVWCADVTYIPMQRGFQYLAVIMDWATRTVLSWRLSNTLDSDFCVEALQEALAKYGAPEIFNTDQGSQFTSVDFTSVLKQAGVQISMDGKGRWMDNVFIERLWRSLKYECVYLHAFNDGHQAQQEIGTWLRYYNEERPHSSLTHDRTPMEEYSRWRRAA
jgi:putative transposase